MADGMLPRDVLRVCRELFRGRYFSTPSLFAYLCTLLGYVFDNYRVMEGCRRRVPEHGSRGRAALGEPLAWDDAGESAAAAGGSASSFIASPASVVAAAATPGSPGASTTSSESNPA